MKALALVTYTENCWPLWRSLEAAGYEVTVERYDDRPQSRHDELVDLALRLGPDFIVYVGAIEQYHRKPVPTIATLKRLNAVAPMIHVCGDASDKAWWPLLGRYHDEFVFAAQVSIDGVMASPLGYYCERALVRLTPVDPSEFCPRPWPERDVALGFSGQVGRGSRAEMIKTLRRKRGLRVLATSGSTYAASYRGMADFMSRCRIVLNVPTNGAGDADHVKGRVVEAGWAGACLMERIGSPTEHWFDPGEDYIQYDGPEDALAKLALADRHPEEVERMAGRLAAKVRERHHPRTFWRDVLAKAGVS